MQRLVLQYDRDDYVTTLPIVYESKEMALRDLWAVLTERLAKINEIERQVSIEQTVCDKIATKHFQYLDQGQIVPDQLIQDLRRARTVRTEMAMLTKPLEEPFLFAGQELFVHDFSIKSQPDNGYALIMPEILTLDEWYAQVK